LRALLTDPSKYAARQNIQISLDNLKEDADKYIDGKAKALEDEQKSLDDLASKADSITGQLARSISLQAKQNNVPMIRPVNVDRDTNREVTVYIDAIDNDVTTLVQKLAASSTLIADMGTSYKNYNIGSWLFSGSKNYVLSVYMPDSEIFALDASRSEIDGLLAGASSFIKGL